MIYNLSATKLFNILFIAAGIGICGLCFIQISRSSHIRKIVRRYFQYFMILMILYIASHQARELMEGIPGSSVHSALSIVTTIEIFLACVMAQMISMLVLAATSPEKNESSPRILITVIYALVIVHALILTVCSRGDLIFYFDEANYYHRASLYLLSNICPFIMLIMDIYLIIKYGKNLSRHIRIAFWIYFISPIPAILLQTLFYGIQYIIIATVVSSVYMFYVILRNQNEKYEKQQIESSRLETELTMASSIQADMLPNIYPAFPERPEFDIYATMDPAKEVGGDFYDFFLVDDDHICLVMADVSGKGVPAALFMMASKIIIASNAKLGISPEQILTDANEAICAGNHEDMFVTIWLGVLELSTGKLVAANAGHEYPIIKQPGEGFEILKDKHGLVVGGIAGVKYRQYELTMKPGSKLFLYTDGVPEATNADNELFGMDRLVTALNTLPDADPEAILKNVRRHVDDFVKDAEQFDDLTMLCFEYKGK